MKTCSTKYALKYRIMGWIGLLIFVPSLFIRWTHNPGVAIGVFSFFVLLSIYGIIEGNSTLEITPDMIMARKVYGRYGIRWDEVRRIQYCVTGDWVMAESMILEGNNKRLAIPGPSDWGGQDGAESRQWFYIEVRRRGLEIKETPSVAFKFSKNVRLL